MTIFDMPAYPVGAFRFWLRRADLMAPESSGRIGGVQMGWPKWVAEYETVAHTEHQAHLWSNWRKGLRGAIHQFKATDPSRWYPFAYRPKALGGGHAGAGGFPGGWDGDATSFTLNGDRSEVTLTIPSGIILTPADLIGFRWDTGLALVEAMEGGVSSGTVTVAVEPAVHDVVPADAVAYLLKPAFLARQAPDSEDPAMPTDGATIGKLVCVQDIVP